MKTLILGLVTTGFLVSTAQADIDPAICGLAGAAAGGAIGSQFGGGDGKKAIAIIGAIIGGVAAHNYCKEANHSDDIRIARENERRLMKQNTAESVPWCNPRFGRDYNSHSRIEKRGWYGERECTMTRSVMNDRGGSYVNETYWCSNRGGWSQVTETTTIQQIQWGARGPIQTTTTTTTVTGGPSMGAWPPPAPPFRPVPPSWIVSENGMARYEADVRRAWPHHERAARGIAIDLSRTGEFITLDQLGRLLAIASFDDNRTAMLRELMPVVDRRFGTPTEALRSYVFDSYREEARRILLPVSAEARDAHPSFDHGGRDPYEHGRAGRRW